MYHSRYGEEQHFIIYLSMGDSHNKHTTVLVEFLARRQDVKSNLVDRSPPGHSSLFGSTFQDFPHFPYDRIRKFCLGKMDKILGRSSAPAPSTQKQSQ